MDSQKKNVAILFGGKSPEHEISIITGIQVLNNIDKNKFNVVPVYIAKDGKWYYSGIFSKAELFKDLESIPFTSQEVYLPPDPNNRYLLGTKSFLRKQFKIKIDVFFPCFHGSLGENGAFQGLLEICEIPYVGSEILGSALGMDKVVCKDIFIANKVPTVSYVHFYRDNINHEIEKIVRELETRFKYPMFVKPSVGGSSVGVTKAKNNSELKHGLELAALFDSKIIVEEGIENAKEINISVMGNANGELVVSVCEEVFHDGEFLTYDDKYKSSNGKSQGMASTKRKIPAELNRETAELIQEIAKKVFSSLNCAGLIRIDFLVKEDPLEINVIEVNTIPGSMAFYLWKASGMSFSNVITKLIELAERRFDMKSKNTYTFSSNILKNLKPGIKNPKLN